MGVGLESFGRYHRYGGRGATMRDSLRRDDEACASDRGQMGRTTMARIAITTTAKAAYAGGANGCNIGLGLARNRTRIAVCVVSLMVSYLLQGRESVAGNEARVRFVTTGNLTILRKYDDDECKKGEQELARLRNGFLLANPGPPLQKIGMPLWEFHENAATELPVATGKRFHGMLY